MVDQMEDFATEPGASSASSDAASDYGEVRMLTSGGAVAGVLGKGLAERPKTWRFFQAF